MQSLPQFWMFPCWEKLSWSRSDGGTSSFPVFSSTTLQSHFWGADLIRTPPPFLFLLKLESFFKVWLRESLHSLLWSSQTDSISLPSPAHNICSLGCHLPARCGYSGSFTVVSNQFVWFSQLDRKVFGSRPRLLWDSMTQWFVWGELLHADDPEGKTHQTVSQFHAVRI